ncbi:MAG TPA: GNAT family N-acetyltransferase [Candidatus Acidoferrales bacterium]|nr:GNAT family N-acetyltransferase [Candidatus Acidoferrales bacterium]
MTPIAENEVGAAVGIFLGAFRDNVRLVYGDDPRPDAMRDVWTFVRQTEPGGFLVARENNDILGYAIFVSSVSALRRKAVRSGAIFGWALRALVGRYGIHWIALARLLWNKTLFVRSSDRFRSEGDAQLLNIAVSPGARGKGIAKLLVHAGLKYLAGEHIQEVRLEVRPENKPAIAAYLANGFVERGRTQDAGGDWIVMTARP